MNDSSKAEVALEMEDKGTEDQSGVEVGESQESIQAYVNGLMVANDLTNDINSFKSFSGVYTNSLKDMNEKAAFSGNPASELGVIPATHTDFVKLNDVIEANIFENENTLSTSHDITQEFATTDANLNIHNIPSSFDHNSGDNDQQFESMVEKEVLKSFDFNLEEMSSESQIKNDENDVPQKNEAIPSIKDANNVHMRNDHIELVKSTSLQNASHNSMEVYRAFGESKKEAPDSFDGVYNGEIENSRVSFIPAYYGQDENQLGQITESNTTILLRNRFAEGIEADPRNLREVKYGNFSFEGSEDQHKNMELSPGASVDEYAVKKELSITSIKGSTGRKHSLKSIYSRLKNQNPNGSPKATRNTPFTILPPTGLNVSRAFTNSFIHFGFHD